MKTIHSQHLAVAYAGELPNTPVYSQQNRQIGKIEDVIVRSGGGHPSFAVVSFEQIEALNQRLVAIPWSVFVALDSCPEVRPTTEQAGHSLSMWGDNGGHANERDPANQGRRFVLNLDSERLHSAPNFEDSHWPDMTNAAWFSELEAFFAEGSTHGGVSAHARRCADSVTPQSGSMPVAARISELVGLAVHGPGGERLGDVNEAVMDRQGRVCYAVISAGGFLGMGERHVAIPWSKLKLAASLEESEAMRATLDTSKDALAQAPTFESGRDYRAQMCSSDYLERVYAHFDARPYWDSASDRSTTGYR